MTHFETDPTGPEPIVRRNFLKQLGLASAAAWMAGGIAAPETFDPKRYAPFEQGMEVNRVLSTFPAIDTAVDNIARSKRLQVEGRPFYVSRDGKGKPVMDVFA